MRWSILALLVACSGQPAPEAAAAKAAPPDAACLNAADLADGTADHVVHNCPGCGMHMPGSADHKSQIGEYELHSCSEACKSKLDANPGALLCKK